MNSGQIWIRVILPVKISVTFNGNKKSHYLFCQFTLCVVPKMNVCTRTGVTFVEEVFYIEKKRRHTSMLKAGFILGICTIVSKGLATTLLRTT